MLRCFPPPPLFFFFALPTTQTTLWGGLFFRRFCFFSWLLFPNHFVFDPGFFFRFFPTQPIPTTAFFLFPCVMGGLVFTGDLRFFFWVPLSGGGHLSPPPPTPGKLHFGSRFFFSKPTHRVFFPFALVGLSLCFVASFPPGTVPNFANGFGPQGLKKKPFSKQQKKPPRFSPLPPRNLFPPTAFFSASPLVPYPTQGFCLGLLFSFFFFVQGRLDFLGGGQNIGDYSFSFFTTPYTAWFFWQFLGFLVRCTAPLPPGVCISSFSWITRSQRGFFRGGPTSGVLVPALLAPCHTPFFFSPFLFFSPMRLFLGEKNHGRGC